MAGEGAPVRELLRGSDPLGDASFCLVVKPADPDVACLASTPWADRTPDAASTTDLPTRETLGAGGRLVSASRVMPLLQTPRVQQTGQFLVGRSRSCDLRVNHPTVSKAHALIGFPPGWPSREHPWHLHDCTSTNGTYVAAPSGLQAAPAQGPGVVLQPGLSIILGAIEILFLDSGGLQDLLEQWRLGSTAATRRPPRPGP